MRPGRKRSPVRSSSGAAGFNGSSLEADASKLSTFLGLSKRFSLLEWPLFNGGNVLQRVGVGKPSISRRALYNPLHERSHRTRLNAGIQESYGPRHRAR